MKGKRTMTPKLRFPEFRDKSEWEQKTVNTISNVNPNNEGLPDSFVYIDLESVEQGKLVSQKVIKREDAPSRAQRVLRQRDVIYQTVRPYQRNNLFFDIEDGRDYVASTGYAQLRAHASPAFLFQLLHTNDFVNKVLAKCTGSNYPAINSSDLADVEVAVPSAVEQKKIADCLGSLDELIAAEGRKLEALRDHKRGLMQQLFPQPGQTQPSFRFPEFLNKGEWEQHTLGDVVSVTKGKGVSKADIIECGATPCIRYAELYTTYGEVITQVKSKTNVPVDDLVLSQVEDVIIPASGETKEDIATCACVIDSGVALGSDLNVLRSDIDGRFFSYYLNAAKRSELAKVAQGDTVAHLYPAQILQLSITVPSNENEQRMIADCLCSLDTLISARVTKIDVLKLHKRGLMQQLFPVPEEL